MSRIPTKPKDPKKAYAQLVARADWLGLLTLARARTDRPITGIVGARVHGRCAPTMRALRARGWVEDVGHFGPSLWALTEAGRLALARAEVETGRGW